MYFINCICVNFIKNIRGFINEMMSIFILCVIGMILLWKGYKYGYMCIYMYLFVIKDFKELLIKIIGYLLIFIYKKFEKLVSKKILKYI